MGREQSPASCSRVRLVATREGIYTTYVFHNLDARCDDDMYIMCTKCPNWNISDIDFGQEGFITYRFVQAGRDVWFNRETQGFEAYQWTAIYFEDFVPITHVINGNRIVEKEKLIIT